MTMEIIPPYDMISVPRPFSEPSCHLHVFTRLVLVLGDTILEWNGRSLVNATFEEAREIMDKCEDIVQLLVLHTSNGEQTE